MEPDDEALRAVAPAVAWAPPPQRRGISYSQPLSRDAASARLAALRNHNLDDEHILPASHSLSYAHHDPSAGVPAGYHPPLPPYQHHPSASYSSAATSHRSVGSASDGSMTLERAMFEYGGGHPSPPYPTPVESSVLSPSPSSLTTAAAPPRILATLAQPPNFISPFSSPLFLFLGLLSWKLKKAPPFGSFLRPAPRKRERWRAPRRLLAMAAPVAKVGWRWRSGWGWTARGHRVPDIPGGGGGGRHGLPLRLHWHTQVRPQEMHTEMVQ